MVQSGSTTATANLNYALEHADLFNVPNPITMGTIYRPFCQLWRCGHDLSIDYRHALGRPVKGITSHRRVIVVSRFGKCQLTGSDRLAGDANPIMLVPFLITPLINMAIALTAINCILCRLLLHGPGDNPGTFNRVSGNQWQSCRIISRSLVSGHFSLHLCPVCPVSRNHQS